MNGILYFGANDGSNGQELWKSDGTASGTVLVKDIRAGTGSAFPSNLTNVNGTLYFMAINDSNGEELWKSDGTDSGTILVLDIASPGGSIPRSLTAVGASLFFAANTDSYGTELYVVVNQAPTDITLSNNALAENLPASSVIGSLATVDPNLGDTFSYQLVAGVGDADNSSFTLSPDGTLRTAANLDYETQNQFSIRVRSTDQDGLWTEKVFTINLIDLPELLASPIVGDGTVQRSMVNQLVLTFDGAITIGSGAFSLVRRGPAGGSVTLQNPTIVNSGGQTLVTLTFDGALTRGTMKALLDGYYQLTIDGTKITRNGQQLDVNADGVTGDLYQFGDKPSDAFFALYGDTNGDGLVGLGEFSQFQATFGKLPSHLAYNPLLDYDGMGVGITDFSQFRLRFGKPKLAWS